MKKFILLATLASIGYSCENRYASTYHQSPLPSKPRELTEEERRREEESWKSFETAIKYENALQLESSEIKTNSNYQSTYYFTVKNTSDDTIIAFTISGERFKVRLRPGKTYSGKMKAESDWESSYRVESIVLASGELVHILGPSNTRHQ